MTRSSLFWLVCACAFGCGCSSESGSGPGGFAFDVQALTLDTSEVRPVVVTVQQADGSSKDVTAEASLSLAGTAAQLTGTTLVGLGRGDCTLTASYGGRSAELPVHVRGWTGLLPFTKGVWWSSFVTASDGRAVSLVGGQLMSYAPATGWAPPVPYPASPGSGGVAMVRVDGDRVLIAEAVTNGIAARIYRFDDASLSEPESIATFPVTIVFLGPLVATPDGTRAVLSFGLNQDDTGSVGGALGTGAVRWSSSGGWAAAEVIDAAAQSFGQSLALDDQGNAVLGYTTSDSLQLRAAWSRVGQPWSKPMTLHSALPDTTYYGGVVAAVNRNGSGALSYEVTSYDSNTFITTAQLHAADITGAAVTGPEVALDPTLGLVSEVHVATALPSGEGVIARERRQTAGSALELIHKPLGGAPSTEAIWPANTSAAAVAAMSSGALWLIALTKAEPGWPGGNGWFAQRLDPAKGWGPALPFAATDFEYATVYPRDDGTMAIVFQQKSYSGAPDEFRVAFYD